MSNIRTIELNSSNFDATVLEGDQPVLVDFWAAWCGPCRAVAPVVEDLAERFDGRARVGKVDVDAHGEIAERYHVRSIPTLAVFKGGVEVERLVGAVSAQDLAAVLERHLEGAATREPLTVA
jgi:thioredoxin 1